MWLAACAGCVHAGFSLYWAAGGTWLLPTVGQWAVDAMAEGSLVATAALAGIGLFKLAALTPVIVEQHGPPPLRRWVCGLAWVGSLGRIVYGGREHRGRGARPDRGAPPRGWLRARCDDRACPSVGSAVPRLGAPPVDELPATNMARVKAFYTQVFGWSSPTTAAVIRHSTTAGSRADSAPT